MRVTNIILRVADMRRSFEFYRDKVGLPATMESPTFSFFDAGSIQLALNQSDSAVGGDESLTEIVLEVDDIAAAHRTMRNRGVPFRIEPREVMRDGDRALHAADFRDPDGHVLSITGWVDDG